MQTSVDTSPNPGVDTTVDIMPQTRYSVLHIMTDDVGDAGLTAACDSDCPLNMPSIDRLRTNGISFASYYTTPACASTRAGVLTGRHSFQHQQHNGQSLSYRALYELEIPEALRLSSSPHKTALVGKLGLAVDSPYADYGYAYMGFDRFVGGTASIAGTGFIETHADATYPAAATSPSFSSTFRGDAEETAAVAFIDSLDDGEPFVLFLWTYVNHNSYYVDPPPDTDEVCDNAGGDSACYVATLQYWDQNNLDAVLDAALAHDPNTLVIYQQDNGDGTVGAVGKGEIKEGGIKGEAIFAYGNIPAGSRNTQSAERLSHVDIFPTIMDYAGAKSLPPHDRKGWSLRNLLSGECTDTGRQHGDCWDGTDTRCIYVGDYGTSPRYRIISCDTAATEGYKYVIESDGSNPAIYEVDVSEDVECSDAACDAAEAELSAAIVAYDGLPGPP